MKRSDAESLQSRRSSDVGSGAVAASNQGEGRKNRRRVSYGLGLLLVALCVGLAAALLLTIGNTHADVFLACANTEF